MKTETDNIKHDIRLFVQNISGLKSEISNYLEDLFKIETEVYWYTQRFDNWYYHSGTVILTNTENLDRCCKILNKKTSNEIWLKLHDLRFWLRDEHPNQNAKGIYEVMANNSFDGRSPND